MLYSFQIFSLRIFALFSTIFLKSPKLHNFCKEVFAAFLARVFAIIISFLGKRYILIFVVFHVRGIIKFSWETNYAFYRRLITLAGGI